MKIIRGKGVCGGVAVGKAVLLSSIALNVKRENISDAEYEIKRFAAARAKAAVVLDRLYERAVDRVGAENAKIFETHKYMIDDLDMTETVEKVIREKMVNAEYAVAVTSDEFAMQLSMMDDDYMSGRSADIKDVSRCILESFRDNTAVADFSDEDGFIVCAEDIAPSKVIMLSKSHIPAIVCAYGSINSHTSILAKNMNIPTVVGVGEELLCSDISGKVMIVDGFTGTVTVEPDAHALEMAEYAEAKARRKKENLAQLVGMENITADGRKIDVLANIASVEDIDAVIESDAGGVGLFRCEGLYLVTQLPSEEYQFAVYRRLAEAMNGKNVIIRTLDISPVGADEENSHEDGYRAIRFSLTHEEIFITQIRALLRAAFYGNLGVLFPMITDVSEMERILMLIDEARQELTDENILYGDIKIGIMIETPAAALISDLLAPMADFMSIGTNDLSEYTLAVSRRSSKLESFYNPKHEAVMRLIEISCKNAHKFGKSIGICGEIAADTTLTERFIRMGIDNLSVVPSEVLRIRRKIRSIDLNEK